MALQGIKVLDLTRVLAGPYCTMTLADLGADVWKVEQPGNGDDARGWAPHTAGGQSAYFLLSNRNKKSLAIDIAKPEGREIVRGLAMQADVLVENFRVGALAKFGLDYTSLHAVNPRLIYCSITGYGHDSPVSQWPGYDFVAQAESGLMSVTGDAEGEPVRVGVPVTDVFTGANATQAILAALFARERTGAGQHLDIALLDCALALMSTPGSESLVTGGTPARYGNRHPSIVPYGAFESADGRFVLTCGNDRQFALFCQKVIDAPGLAVDPLYDTNAARVRNRQQLEDHLNGLFRSHGVDHWLERMRSVGVPCARIRSIDQALQAPEILARGMVVEAEHPVAGRARMIGSPLRMSGTPVRPAAAPPLLGEHTAALLAGVLGYGQDRIDQLSAQGVIGCGGSS
jgi:crotonobetainyl-CoA:carnitine CoA-transferase CaiB-like acyl-CoA transferase